MNKKQHSFAKVKMSHTVNKHANANTKAIHYRVCVEEKQNCSKVRKSSMLNISETSRRTGKHIATKTWLPRAGSFFVIQHVLHE